MDYPRHPQTSTIFVRLDDRWIDPFRGSHYARSKSAVCSILNTPPAIPKRMPLHRDGSTVLGPILDYNFILLFAWAGGTQL